MKKNKTLNSENSGRSKGDLAAAAWGSHTTTNHLKQAQGVVATSVDAKATIKPLETENNQVNKV